MKLVSSVYKIISFPDTNVTEAQIITNKMRRELQLKWLYLDTIDIRLKNSKVAHSAKVFPDPSSSLYTHIMERLTWPLEVFLYIHYDTHTHPRNKYIFKKYVLLGKRILYH